MNILYDRYIEFLVMFIEVLICLVELFDGKSVVVDCEGSVILNF